MAYPYAPEYDDQDEELTPSVPQQPQAPSYPGSTPQQPLANPVLRPAQASQVPTIPSFETPAQAAAPTVLQPFNPPKHPGQIAASAQTFNPPTVPTAAPAAPPAAQDDGSSADALTAMVGQGQKDDAAEEARQQELRNQHATAKYQKSQGVAMVTTANGQTQAATDAEGILPTL